MEQNQVDLKVMKDIELAIFLAQQYQMRDMIANNIGNTLNEINSRKQEVVAEENG